MSLENRPMGGEQGAQQSEIIVKKNNVGAEIAKGLAVLTAIANMPAEAQAGSPWREVLQQAGVKIVTQAMESRENKKAIGSDTVATTELNRNFEFPFTFSQYTKPRFELHKSEMSGLRGMRSSRGRRGWGAEWRNMDGLTQAMLQDVFPGCSFVADPEEVRRESFDRMDERANPEVDQSTVPESGTIVRGNAEIKQDIQLFQNQKDLETYLRQYGWRESKGLNIDFEKTKIIAVVAITFVDRATKQEQTFVSFGTEIAYSQIAFEQFSRGFGSGIRMRKIDDGSSEFKAVAQAYINAREVLKLKVNQAKMRPDNRVHHTGEGDNEIKTGEPKE